MIQVVKPKIGERIYDGACGLRGLPVRILRLSAHSRPRADHQPAPHAAEPRPSTARRRRASPTSSAIMNMILHGIEAPNIVHTNTLAENISDIQEKDRFDVILANPPFGGKERKEVQQNFPIKTGETAFLFLQHFIKYAEGRRPGGHRHQEHLPLELRQRLAGAAQGAAGELQPAHRPRLPAGHVPRRRGEDGGAVLREGRADAQDLVLPARSRPQPRQDQCRSTTTT